MTGLRGDPGELAAQVRRRAEQRALGIEASAEGNAQEILDQAAERAQAIRAKTEEEGRRAAEEACRQCLAVADLERRRRRLEAREARLDRVWEAARQRLHELADGGIDPDTLARLARHAARELGGDEVAVRLDDASASNVDENDVAGWAEQDGPALRLDPEPLPRRHGVVAHAGRSSIDATLEGRLDQAQGRLRAEIDALLTASAPDAQQADAQQADAPPTRDGGDDA
ncbi:MAG: V-type ATP synthase subunit E family protein [Trueperaceae bacterium]|nr:V-type ATP synthase subunit E family protein [Trueperaceae bacterium]